MEVTFSEAKIPTPPPQKPIKPVPAEEPATPPAATPPAETPPATTAPPSRTPTVQELNDATSDMYKSMGWGDAPPPETPAAPAATDAPAAAPQPELQPQPDPEPEPEPELSPREMIAETARQTAQAVAQAIAPKETPAPETAPAFELTPQDADDLEVLRYMSRTNQAHAGLDQRFLDWCKQHYEYQAAWETANPDKEFNPDDEEHAQFYETNRPDIDADAVDKSRMDMLVERKFEERAAPERAKQKADKAFQDALPEIAQRIDAKVHAMVCQMNPELGKLISGANGEPMLTNETIAKVDEADPIAKRIGDRIVSEELEPMILELEKIAIPELGYVFDPQKNPIHATIAKFLGKQESEMAKAPRSVQVKNGAQWITLREYNTRLNAINQAGDSQGAKDARKSELNRNYWTLTVDDASDLIVDYCAKKAKAEVEEQDGLAKRKYLKTPRASTTQPATAAPQPAATPVNQPRKPVSPSVGGQPDTTTNTPLGQQPQKSFGETAVEVNFR